MSKEIDITEVKSAFDKMKKGYEPHCTVINELFYLSWHPNAERQLHSSPQVPGMPIPKHPNSLKECTYKKALKEIESFKTSSKRLVNKLETLHSPTIYALSEHKLEIEKLERILNSIDEISDKAIATINDMEQRFPIDKNVEIGRPPKEIPFYIAKILLKEYEEASGKKGTKNWNNYKPEVRSQFFTFVKDVFLALRIDAKPDSMASIALEAKYPPKKKEKSLKKESR